MSQRYMQKGLGKNNNFGLVIWLQMDIIYKQCANKWSRFCGVRLL